MACFNLTDWSTAALGVIERRRVPVYPKSRMTRKTRVRRPDIESRDQTTEKTRWFYKQISQYCLLPADEEGWIVRNLLKEGRHESDHLESMSWRVRSPGFSCSDELLNIPGPPPGPFTQNSAPTTRVAEDTRPIPPATGVSGENHPAGTIDDSESDGWEDAAAV